MVVTNPRERGYSYSYTILRLKGASLASNFKSKFQVRTVTFDGIILI